MRKIFVLACLAFLTAAFPAPSSSDEAGGTFSPYVAEGGRIILPRDYRQSWAHLGSWVVPDESAPGAGFHDVYAQQRSVEAFRDSGSFPDGSVLVKEIRKVYTKTMTTGEASRAGGITVWFVMIKDGKGRYANNPAWGDGWGWGLFDASEPSVNKVKDYKKDCIPCHLPAKDDDWVYIEGYPTLTE